MDFLFQRRLVVLIPLALAYSVSALAQSQKSKTPLDEYKESASNTYFVTCGNEPPYKTRTAVSPVLVSPSGENAAFARVRVSTPGNGNCYNESELFIRRGKTQPFKRVLLIKPEEQEQANGIKLIDWSPDGDFLLFETVGWQYGSDASLNEAIVLFEIKNANVVHPYLENVFSIDPPDCNTHLRALGFTDSAHFVVMAHSAPYYDPGDESPRNTACLTSDQLWSVGLSNPSLKRLDSYKVHRFGHRAAASKNAPQK